MQIYSQRNPLWGNIRIGKSPCLISRYGCTLCCLAMLAGVTPDKIAKKDWFTSDGLILWTKINLPNVKFEKRLYGNVMSEIKESLKNKNKAVMLQVQGNHWVLASSI